MPSVTPSHPHPAVEADRVLRVPALRPPTPTTRPRTGATPLTALAQARVRESASRNATAAELFDAGRFDEAVATFAQALASCRSTLGSEHPDTLTVAGNLGVAYVCAGQRRKGIKLIMSNVAARARILGDTHPDTLSARNALAAAHRLNGDADAAVDLAKQVVLQRSRSLGPTHVDTLSSRMGLALALAAAGDVVSAHRLLASTMNDAETALGSEHEHTVALVECGEAAGLLKREV